MSKSYSKNIFLGVCYGSNTEYYHKRRQLKRRRNKQYLRNAMQFEDIDENLKECNMPIRDSWDEPNWWDAQLTDDMFPEVTFENSPQEIELKLVK